MLHITSATPLNAKALKLKFEEYPQEFIADMSEYIRLNKNFNLIHELEDEKKFCDFIVDHGAILWNNGFDIAPEYLFFLANKSEKKYKALFEEWGYI